MKAIKNSELAKFIDELPRPAGPFKPTATHDPDGDCIEFMFKADDYYAERIDDIVTVYYSRKTSELIGSVIKNVSSIKRKYPSAFAISVEDGTVKLRHLFIATAGALDLDNTKMLIYRKLAEVAEETQAEATLCEA